MRGLAAALLVAASLAACGPAALAPDQIVPAFVAASQDSARTMHMEWQGTLSTTRTGVPELDLGASSQEMTAVFDFNGSDYAGSITTGSQDFGSTAISYARVDGVTFINYADSGWQRSDAQGQATLEIDPLHGLSADDLAYEGAETRDGRSVHRLRVLDPAAALSRGLFGQTAFAGVSLAPGGRADFLVYVDAAGIPVAAAMALDLTMQLVGPDAGGDGLGYGMTFDYTFTLWGEPVTISTPQVNGDGGGFDDGAQPPGEKPLSR